MNIEINPQPDHLRVVVSGEFNLQQIDEYLKDVFAACALRRISKVLVDVRNVVGGDQVMDRYFTGQKLGDHHRNDIQWAFVATAEQIWPDRFMVNVAVNHGAQMMTSSDPAAALAWLRAGGENKLIGGTFSIGCDAQSHTGNVAVSSNHVVVDI
jgi:hypothetical protein